MSASWLRAIFGLGFLGGWPASGAWGSLVGLSLAWWLPFWPLAALTVLFSLVGLASCHSVVEKHRDPDPLWFIWDEVCGMMISLLWAPKKPTVYITAYIVFRVLDVWKPGFLRTLDKKTGPMGIMWDDLAAGAITAAILYLATSTLFGPPAL